MTILHRFKYLLSLIILMKNLKKMLLELDKLDLPRDKYAIFGSAPLAAHGIRDVDDLDIIVKPELWQELEKKYPKLNEKEIKIGNIEIFNSWKPWFDDVNKLIDDSEIIDGYRFVKLKYVLGWKRTFGREKDQKDVKKIEDYMSNLS